MKSRSLAARVAIFSGSIMGSSSLFPSRRASLEHHRRRRGAGGLGPDRGMMTASLHPGILPAPGAGSGRRRAGGPPGPGLEFYSDEMTTVMLSGGSVPSDSRSM